MTNFFLHAKRSPNLLNHGTGAFYQIRHYGKEMGVYADRIKTKNAAHQLSGVFLRYKMLYLFSLFHYYEFIAI